MNKGPMDVIGNTLNAEDYVVWLGAPLIGKVVAVEAGGIHTPKGVTTPKVRIVFDIILGTAPGQPIGSLAKVTNPTSEFLASTLAGKA